MTNESKWLKRLRTLPESNAESLEIDQSVPLEQTEEEVGSVGPPRAEADVQALTTMLLRMKPVEMDAILKVLAWLGYENFKLLDPIMDWTATVTAINHPIRTVICNILDAKGKIVRDKGKPIEVARNFPDDADIDAILAKESLVFVRLWDS